MEEQNQKAKQHLMQATTILIIILSLVSIALFFLAVQWVKIAGAVDQNQNTITVTGEAEVFAIPDIARLSFSVVEEAVTVAEAQEKATEKNNAIIAFLAKENIEEKDIKTISYNVNPKYEYYYEYDGVRCLSSYCPPPYFSKQEIVGYTITQSVEVTIRDLEQAGDLLAGIGEYEIRDLGQLYFEIEKEDEIREEARAKAIEDGREEAKRLARELGVRLGKIVSFSEGGYYPQPYYDRAIEVGSNFSGKDLALTAPPSPEIPTGENKITANVTIVYEVK